jgi:hypothetical protein
VRSTTFVLKDLCTCIKKSSFSISKTSTRSRCQPECRRVTTPRALTRCVSRLCRAPPQRPCPRPPPVEAARRPRPRAFPRSSPLPRCLDCPAPRASPPPGRMRAVHATDRRSVRGPVVRASAEERRSTAASRPRHSAVTASRFCGL